MSTRALYTFKDEDASWNVYKHHDGYPTGAARTITQALEWFAWTLPRFEADEFACAFITAAKAHFLLDYATADDQMRESAKDYFPGGTYRKHSGGGARMMPQGDPLTVASQHCADVQYRYEISATKTGVRVRAFSVDAWGDKPTEKLLFSVPLSRFASRAEEFEAKRAA